MATRKKVSADQKQARKANANAVKGFPKSKLRTAFEVMADTTAAGDAASEARAVAALDVCQLAESFAVKNEGVPTDTITAGWRDHLKGLIMELAVAGNRFAELTEADGDKPATAKLTGYGNNVASIAKGTIEFGIEAGDLQSYRSVRQMVEARRAEARRESDPDGAMLADAKAEAVEAWDDLRKAVFDTGDVGLIAGLTAMLSDGLAEFEAAQAEQAEVEAEAEAA